MWTYKIDPDAGVIRSAAHTIAADLERGDAALREVRITPDADWRTLLAEHPGLAVIALEFADFTDGRAFSVARQLRRAGFTGELRATGDILVDQLQYLNRCGFDAFDLPESVPEAQVVSCLAEISVRYQAA